MAKVIRLKDRQGSFVLPLTRSQLVQVSEITGLSLEAGKEWSSASVQDALKALYTYVTTVGGSNDDALADIATIKDALEDLLSTTRAVANAIETAQANAYAYTRAEVDTAKDLAYAYTRAEVDAAYTNAEAYTRAEVDTAYAAAIAYTRAEADTAEQNAKDYADDTFLNNVKLNGSYVTVDTDETYGRYVDLGQIATSSSLQSLTDKVEAIEAAYATSAALGELQSAYETGYAALENRISANESAIETLNGSASTPGSVAYQVSEGIAGVIDGAPEAFDTLKEIATWIGEDTTGAAQIQSYVNTLRADDTTPGSVAYAVKNAKDTIDDYTVNGYKISTNPVLDSGDIAYAETTVEAAIADLYSQVGEGGSVSTQIENAINALDASYTATGTAAHSGTYVMNAVTQTDGVITSIGSVEVENAGAAQAVKTELLGDATTYTNLGLVEDELTYIYNNGMFYEQVGTSTIDDVTLSSFSIA